ncbi:MAG: hypothetical protein J6P40_00445 [Oscillospiraceae bacterium]|nr:hypothetical protein [Oscillospiraceae bacterium]
MISFIQEISNVLTPIGFKKRGNSFFASQGDGILLTVQAEKERNVSYPGHPFYILGFSLMSMYSELLPQYFTGWGSIARYTMVNLIGEKAPFGQRETGYNENGLIHVEQWEYSIEEQIEILRKTGIDFLLGIQDQYTLIAAMIDLETAVYGEADLLDIFKYAPFLYTGRYSEAEEIISRLLLQHETARENRLSHGIIPNEDQAEREKKETEEFQNLRILVHKHNSKEIKEYLNQNYTTNEALKIPRISL